MGAERLSRARAAGAPLVEVVVRFHPGVDTADAPRRFDALGDDFVLWPGDWHGDPSLRVGTATPEALERLFGWRLARVPMERYDEAAGRWGTWDHVHRWQEMNRPQHFPAEIGERIESIWLTQPGADDDGEPWP